MILFFVLSFLLGNTALGQSYYCSLNLAPNGTTLDSSQLKDFVRTFEFDFNAKSGRSSKLKNVSVFVFKSKGRIYIQIKDEKKDLKFVSHYSPKRDEILVKLSPNTEFKCLAKSKVDSGKAGQNEVLLHQKITLTTDLKKVKHMVRFKALNNWKISWFQQNVNGTMRPILWSNGNVYTADDRSKLQSDYCIFNFNLKLTENTFVPKGKTFDPLNFEIYNNNQTHTVYSYSFVDFGKGKKNKGTSRYSPFSFECSISNKTPFTYGLIQAITGGRVGLETRR